jgi:hypothetical protein
MASTFFLQRDDIASFDTTLVLVLIENKPESCTHHKVYIRDIVANAREEV